MRESAVHTKCVACGKNLEVGQEIAVIMTGKLSRALSIARAVTWGKMHKECFDKAIPSRKAVLELLREQAKAIENGKQPGKKNP